jgi:hypothetical protein
VFQGMQGHPATLKEANFAVIQNRESGLYRPVRDWVNNRTPIYSLKREGAQLMGVYAH